MIIQIYVGTYAKYNNGSIEGAWVDLEALADEEEFQAVIKELHKDEEDPEYMFQDFEGFPSEFYSESGLDSRIWEFLELDDDDKERLIAFLDCFGECAEDVFEAAESAYYGTYANDIEFAYEMVESCYNLEEPLASYFDYERYARDLMQDYSCSNNYYFASNW